jgi:protein-S-isoprenylcysteine O-methyltransferase Ste14
MPIEPWDLVFLVGFAVYVGIRHVYAARTKGEERVESRIDGLERSLLPVVFLGSLLFPVLYLFTPVLSFADYRLPGPLPWIGAAVMLVALWLFRRSHADLGPNWSISLELRRDHRLIQHGVYRSIRHPMYLAIWLWSMAQAMLLQNWLAGWSAFVTFAPLYFVRAPREEAMMCRCFGEEYRAYMARTGRILPRLTTGKKS